MDNISSLEGAYVPSKQGDAANQDNHGSQQVEPLSVRIGYGRPPESQSRSTDSQAKQDGTAGQKPAESQPKQESTSVSDASAKPADKGVSGAASDTSKVDTGAIYDIQKKFAQVQNIQQTLAEKCFEKQADGTLKPKDDKAKVEDGSKDGTTVEVMRNALLSQMSEAYENAVTRADGAMQNPDSVVGATMSVRKELEARQQQTKTIQDELKSQGIDPSVSGTIDSTLVSRYLDEHKDLRQDQRDKAALLGESLQKQSQMETQYRDLLILQETPIITRHSYSDFLRTIGLPNAADKWMTDANKTAEDLNSPAGRSDFMKRQTELTNKDKEDSFEKALQEKYLKPQRDLATLVDGAAEKAKNGDVAGARADMDKARDLAGNMPAVDKEDENQIKSRGEQLLKDRATLDQRVKDGSATPYDATVQHDKELKLVNEAKLLEGVKLSKHTVDIAYADFLLNSDKDKDSDNNRKAARDLLMGVKADSLGKVAAVQQAERFDKLLEQSINGNIDNQAAMKAFNTSMQEYEALRKKVGSNEKDEDMAKDLRSARDKAAQAAEIAGHINRDAADDNQKAVMTQLQKQLDVETAKPEAERDQGKVALMQAVMKPNYKLDAHEKELIAGLTEFYKPEGQADKAAIDKLSSTLKDKSALYDIVSSYSMIQQMQFQKQAVNQARMAMLDIDMAFKKCEDSPLVKDIEKDKYGAEMIDALNAMPGKDKHSQWDDVKDATKHLKWYQKAWNWIKGAFKEIAISLASWTVGALAGIGAATLFSWSGPGAVIGGAAVGFAAGAATGTAIRKIIGDKISLKSALLDGVSGMTGGIAGTTYAVARAAGTSAIENVVAQQAEKGVVIGTDQTWAAFKAAGIADKAAIAAGGNRFLASFTAANTSSVAYRIPSEALTGNYKNFGDYAKSTSLKIAEDIPGNLMSSWLNARGPGNAKVQSLELDKNFYGSAMKQVTSNFLWASPPAKALA